MDKAGRASTQAPMFCSATSVRVGICSCGGALPDCHRLLQLLVPRAVRGHEPTHVQDAEPHGPPFDGPLRAELYSGLSRGLKSLSAGHDPARFLEC